MHPFPLSGLVFNPSHEKKQNSDSFKPNHLKMNSISKTKPRFIFRLPPETSVNKTIYTYHNPTPKRRKMPTPKAEQTTAESVSIADIPTIVRRKSTENFTELDAQLSALKSNQAKVLMAPRTKKNELNRQYSVKIQKHLGNAWTVTSRMGSQLLKQNPTELYVYVYRTPIQEQTKS